MSIIDELREIRPDLDTGDLLKAHATWALRSALSWEAGDGELDVREYVLAWEKPVHPLTAMFKQAIENGHPVTVIDGGRVAKFNEEERL